MSIDTLAVARRLESAKLPREQAEAIAAVFHESETTTFANLATRSDLQTAIDGVRQEIESFRKEFRGEIDVLRRELLGEVASLRKETENNLKLLEQRMTIKLGMMMVGAIAVMATLMKLL